MAFIGSDIWKVRQKWGNGPLVWAGVSVIAMNNDGLVWMGKRIDNGHWNIVGGHFELGDSAEAAARREVLEEVGLKITDLSMIGVITDPKLTHTRYPNGDEIQSPSFVFVALLEEGTPHADDEHTEFKWVEPEDVVNIVIQSGGKGCTAMEMYENWLETEEFQIK